LQHAFKLYQSGMTDAAVSKITGINRIAFKLYRDKPDELIIMLKYSYREKRLCWWQNFLSKLQLDALKAVGKVSN